MSTSWHGSMVWARNCTFSLNLRHIMKIALRRGRDIRARLSLLALRAILVVVLSGCTSSSGIFAGGSWQLSSLTHQHIRTLVADTNNSQAIYAGGGEGKIFASTDGGQHWTERSAGLPLS